VENWVRDDCPSVDIGGLVVGDKIEDALLYGKSKGILAGVPFFTAVFEHLGCSILWKFEEGVLLEPCPGNEKILVAIVRGPARKLLLGERTALNLLSRASGVATSANSAAQVARDHGWHGHIAGTRKTTPGFRIVEKYALLVGGAATHRLDLSNMVMLKDNHIWSAGNITSAVKMAKRAAGFTSKIEVECRSLEEGHEAASAGADIVMLDNFEPEELKMAAALLKASHPYLIIEASGGITHQTMYKYFSPHVDVISRGNLTQGYPCLDFSLKIKQGGSSGHIFPQAIPNASITLNGNMMNYADQEGGTKSSKKARKRRAHKVMPERVIVPGAYRCIKGPAIAYRLSMNLENRDMISTPVKLGDVIRNCVECTPAAELGASWLRIVPHDSIDNNPRYLPTFIDGEALFEPILEAIVTHPKKPYEVPEMQKYYTVFSALHRATVKAQFPDAVRGQINRELGKKWRELTDEQKRQFTPDMLPAQDKSKPNDESEISLKRVHDDDDDDEYDDDEEEEDEVSEQQGGHHHQVQVPGQENEGQENEVVVEM